MPGSTPSASSRLDPPVSLSGPLAFPLTHDRLAQAECSACRRGMTVARPRRAISRWPTRGQASMPIALAWERRVLGTLVSLPQMRRQYRRRSMRVSRPRSQSTPFQDVRVGRRSGSTDPRSLPRTGFCSVKRPCRPRLAPRPGAQGATLSPDGFRTGSGRVPDGFRAGSGRAPATFPGTGRDVVRRLPARPLADGAGAPSGPEGAPDAPARRRVRLRNARVAAASPPESRRRPIPPNEYGSSP